MRSSRQFFIGGIALVAVGIVALVIAQLPGTTPNQQELAQQAFKEALFYGFCLWGVLIVSNLFREQMEAALRKVASERPTSPPAQLLAQPTTPAPTHARSTEADDSSPGLLQPVFPGSSGSAQHVGPVTRIKVLSRTGRTKEFEIKSNDPAKLAQARETITAQGGKILSIIEVPSTGH